MFDCLYFINFVFEYVLNKGYPLEANIIHRTNTKSRGCLKRSDVSSCESKQAYADNEIPDQVSNFFLWAYDNRTAFQ